jgi:cyclic pyranopterin phosphate synthase
VTLDLTIGENAVEIAATVRTTGQTGVEMEALTAASVAALTVYDMCKSVDRAMRIDALRVTHKAGGKSGEFTQP